MHAPKARTLRSVRSVNRHAPVAAIYDFNFSVPAGTEFCEAAVKWKSVADFYPQGVCGIRKAAKLPTAAQDCRARRQIMLNLFWREYGIFTERYESLVVLFWDTIITEIYYSGIRTNSVGEKTNSLSVKRMVYLRYWTLGWMRSLWEMCTYLALGLISQNLICGGC